MLIVGMAMFIFGPFVGWLLTIAGYFQTANSTVEAVNLAAKVAVANPFQNTPDYQPAPSNIIYEILPGFIGMVCGAVGLFIILYSLAVHFFRDKPEAVKR